MLPRGLLSTLTQHRFCCPAPLPLLHSQRCFANSKLPSASLQPRRPSVAAAAAAGDGAGSGDTPSSSAQPVGRRRRRLFKTDTERQHEQDAQQPAAAQAQAQDQQQQQTAPQQQQQQQAAPLQRQQAQHEDPQPARDPKQQQQQGWWRRPSAPSGLLLHVFWDLDNLNPAHWNQAPDLVRALKDVLRPYGRLQQLNGYANGRTLVTTVDTEGLREEVEAEELRCPICGRRSRSLDELRKHFRQLHEREHQKKMRGPKKFASKYATSDKAARVRDAVRLYGTPKKNRTGVRGQVVKLLLQQAGVKVIEVAPQRQAADDAINRHTDNLTLELAQLPPQLSPSRLAAAAGAADGDDSSDTLTEELRQHLRTLGSAQACLAEMVGMEQEEDFKAAWKYLRQMWQGGEGKKPQWGKLWRELEKGRRTAADGDPRVLAAPFWLTDAWDAYHAQQQEQQQEQQLVQEAVSAAAAAAAAGQADPVSALQQSVLVVVSDDRGFAGTVARWLQRGGAGAVLVTTRGDTGWQQPLRAALGSHNCLDRACDVMTLDWIRLLDRLPDLNDGAEDEWGEDGFGMDAVEEQQQRYEWMMAQGLL